MSQTQCDVETAASTLEAKGCVDLTFESNHGNPQTVIDYGVAQMTNIGVVLSSTFVAVNDKFTALDHLVQKSLVADAFLREELGNQQREILSLKLAVDYIMDKLKEIYPTLKMSKLNDGFTVAAAFPGQIHAQSSVAAKGEISQSVAPLSEFLDSEKSFTANLANHSDQYRDTDIGSVDLAPKLLTEIDCDLDSKLELSENVGNIHDKSCVISRQVVLNLDLASVSEHEVKGIQHSSIELPSISDSDVERSISQPKLMSSRWEPPMPDILYKQDTRSPVDLNEAIHIRATFAIEDLQYYLHGNDSAHSTVTSTVTSAAHVAPVSAVESNRGTGGDTVLEREKEKERERERERFAMEIEVMKSQIAKLQSDAVLSNYDLEAQVRDLSEQLLDTQEGIKSGLHSSPAFKRLHLSLAEITAEMSEMKAREIALAHSKQAENDSIRTGAFSVELEISHAKNMLLNLREDLDFGLDSYADNHAEDPEGNEAFGSPFVVRIGEMADGLDRIILQCQTKESAEATLCSLFRPMDALSVELDALLEMDRIAAESSGVTFDDVTAAGKSRRVRDTMRKVLEACLSLLDRKVNKITMRRRLTALEKIVSSKADLSSFLSMEAELRAMMAAKVDHADLLSITSKKVSLGEHERLKDQLMKQIVSIRGFDSSAAQQRFQGDVSDAADPNSAIELLARRFEILYSFHEDLAAQCRSYVPREEVEQALRALLAEMKVMKNNSVTPDTFADSLSTKASATEVQRLVAALTGALGGIEGKQDEASATHTRCLICDKPVKSIAVVSLTSSKGARAFSPSHYSIIQHSTSSGASERDSVSTASMPVRQGLVPYPSPAVLLSQTLPHPHFRSQANLLQASPGSPFPTQNHPRTSSAPNGSGTQSATGQYSKHMSFSRTSADPDGETQGPGDASHLPALTSIVSSREKRQTSASSKASWKQRVRRLPAEEGAFGPINHQPL